MLIPDSISTWVREVVINGIIGAHWFPRPLRWRALRLAGIKTERAKIQARVYFSGRNVTIGSNSLISEHVFIGGQGPVVIGANVGIAAHAMLVPVNHEICNVRVRYGDLQLEPVVIGDGSWIGAGAILLPGVTVGEGVIIGAGSVVTKDCEPNAIYAGNPARLLRRLEPLQPLGRPVTAADVGRYEWPFGRASR